MYTSFRRQNREQVWWYFHRKSSDSYRPLLVADKLRSKGEETSYNFIWVK